MVILKYFGIFNFNIFLNNKYLLILLIIIIYFIDLLSCLLLFCTKTF